MIFFLKCAAVNFVTGANETLGDSCSNSTSSFQAEWNSNVEEGESDHSGHGGDHADHADEASESGSSATPSESAADGTSASEGAGAMATAGMGAFVGGLGALAAGLML